MNLKVLLVSILTVLSLVMVRLPVMAAEPPEEVPNVEIVSSEPEVIEDETLEPVQEESSEPEVTEDETLEPVQEEPSEPKVMEDETLEPVQEESSEPVQEEPSEPEVIEDEMLEPVQQNLTYEDINQLDVTKVVEMHAAVLQIRNCLIFLIFGVIPLIIACVIIYLFSRWIYRLILSTV